MLVLTDRYQKIFDIEITQAEYRALKDVNPADAHASPEYAVEYGTWRYAPRTVYTRARKLPQWYCDSCDTHFPEIDRRVMLNGHVLPKRITGGQVEIKCPYCDKKGV